MFEKMDDVKKAKAQMVEGALTIWNTRLESLVKTGDVKSVLDHMMSPVEIADNCSCGNNCSCGSALKDTLGDIREIARAGKTK